ncbi:MAG TPA: hypothetical protein VF712_02575 [Thermoleophilaceae bacterium]|jgi:hypothetical protein
MLSAALAAPAVAQPPSCDAPPGVAGIEQYCESTPGTSREPRDPRGGRDSGPVVPRDTADRVRGEPGGTALLESLPPGSAATGPAEGGTAANPSGGAGGRGGRGANRRGATGGSPRSDATEPAPGDALSGVASAASSVWLGEMRGVIVLLALTLVVAVALGARRRVRVD